MFIYVYNCVSGMVIYTMHMHLFTALSSLINDMFIRLHHNIMILVD